MAALGLAGNATTTTYRLEPIEGGTRVTLRHEGFADRADSCRGHAEGWERVFGWLTKYLTAAEERKTYFCRLMPPRFTFIADMTAEERALMGEHAAYWRGMLDQGAASSSVRSADRRAAGAGVLRASSEAALHAMRDGDPVIKANRGFHYEILPDAPRGHSRLTESVAIVSAMATARACARVPRRRDNRRFFQGRCNSTAESPHNERTIRP